MKLPDPVPESGRVVDPSVASVIPVDVFLYGEAPAPIILQTESGEGLVSGGAPVWRVRISAWIRATDEIVEFDFTHAYPVERRVRPPDAEDREWLKNIGAYGKEQQDDGQR